MSIHLLCTCEQTHQAPDYTPAGSVAVLLGQASYCLTAGDRGLPEYLCQNLHKLRYMLRAEVRATGVYPMTLVTVPFEETIRDKVVEAVTRIAEGDFEKAHDCVYAAIEQLHETPLWREDQD